MTENRRLNRASDWLELEFVERERTPEEIIEVGVQLHLAGVSRSNTNQCLKRLGVERSRTAVHDWVQKADLQPTSDVSPNQIAVDETVIRVDDERHWLYAAVDPKTNELLHVRLFHTRTTQFTVLFLRELCAKQQVEQATFLVDAAAHLRAALERLGLRLQVTRYGNRTSVERVFNEVKRRTSSFSNTVSNAATATAESWLQAFAVWYNRCQS